jgi:hypothetical protein
MSFIGETAYLPAGTNSKILHNDTVAGAENRYQIERVSQPKRQQQRGILRLPILVSAWTSIITSTTRVTAITVIASVTTFTTVTATLAASSLGQLDNNAKYRNQMFE